MNVIDIIGCIIVLGIYGYIGYKSFLIQEECFKLVVRPLPEPMWATGDMFPEWMFPKDVNEEVK